MATDGETIQGIECRLDMIIRLLAAPLVKDKSVGDGVRALSDLGLDRKHISAVCHTSPDAVRAYISEGKRRGKSPRARPTTAKHGNGEQT
jgi:hypothetical protein